jgi:hypothetical protein
MVELVTGFTQSNQISTPLLLAIHDSVFFLL